VGCHFSVVLAGNGVARLVGTLFKNASTLDNFFGIWHRKPRSVGKIMLEAFFRTSEHGFLMSPAEPRGAAHRAEI
jgi:hypothetical protein